MTTKTIRKTVILPVLVMMCRLAVADHHIPGLATAIELGQPVNNNSFEAFYELQIPESGTLNVHTESDFDTYGELMLEDETKLGTSDNDGEGSNFSISLEIAAGTYYVRVLNFDSGDYTLITELVTETEQGSGIQVELDQTLAGVRTTDGSETTAVLTAGATADDGVSTATDFSAAEDIMILGAVAPQPEDVGQAGEIFIVLRTLTDSGSAWFYRDVDGVFRPWSVKIAELEPAYQVEALGETEVVEIFSGSLQVASHRVFIGYSLPDGPLHYNGLGMKLDVSAE